MRVAKPRSDASRESARVSFTSGQYDVVQSNQGCPHASHLMIGCPRYRGESHLKTVDATLMDYGQSELQGACVPSSV
jgi:hypothetical protein